MNKHFSYFSVAYFTSNSFEKQALSTATTNMSVAPSLNQTLIKPERSE
jgi:hypothetical protein